MPLYAVPHKELRGFAASTNEKKKRYSIPREVYRVREDDRSLKELKGVDDLKRSVEAFEGVKQISKTIYQRFNKEKTVSLADFKILKEIGKGSFGIVICLHLKSRFI